MRHFGVFTLVGCVVLAGVVAGQNEADNQIKGILDRAAKALGGADKLAQVRGVTWKGKGSFRQMNIAIVFEGETAVQDSNKFRHDLNLGENQANAIVVVVTADKSWIKAGKTMPLPDQLAPLRSNFYALALAQRPHALGQKMFTLTYLGEVEVEGKAAQGLRVAQKGWPEVNVYYDKESGLPIKSEVRVKDPASAQEVADEFFLSEFKVFDGIRHYTKVVGKRDGNAYLERELTDIRWHETLPETTFAMP